MQKTPSKDMHSKQRGLWTERTRVESGLRGELTENRARLGRLLTSAQERTLQIGAILREKANEQNTLKKRLDSVFKKTPAIAHRKALARTRMELENHLHHTMRELDLKRTELKKIYLEVNRIKDHLRKS